jgi:predicted neutral ceramidase superfamily lipid hydrolase
MVLFIELVKMALKQNTFILFFVLVILGILFYLGVLSLLDRLFKGGFLHIIGEQIRLIKGKWFPNG